MNKIVPVTGYCPTQDMEYTIHVTYVDRSCLSGKVYQKGNFECSYNETGENCHCVCPIRNSVPEILNQ